MAEKEISKKDIELIEKVKDACGELKKEMHQVIVGQDEVIEHLLISIFAKGHCLLVGVPGLAKTLMIKTLSRIMDLNFKRIQFTPDLMPSDITGTEILREDKKTGQRELVFVKGPIFANVILADEINRTPPKTQAALLEAMQEYHVTAGGITYGIEPPFFVLATQNPIEQEGTYPLPEAQLDRFMFNLVIKYPTAAEEVDVVKNTTVISNVQLKKVLGSKEILEMQNAVLKVPVPENVIEYAVKLVGLTRPEGGGNVPDFVKKYVGWGASPRASQYLVLGGKVRAVLEGRYNVSKDDIKSLAHPVLRHRVIVNFYGESEGMNSVSVIDKVIEYAEKNG
jgi:MoxR-like ATPase